ncbi:hypothetical protein CAOG_07227 [Capsaspora owczarzaki ATCC 30864]|uniref:Uncharacterized protein n=1 Tax=Capsaspora owczarzaki (strain ATCC 30864) TaxID=595528 RepID=A0A0D2UQQ1_CAPO3|nr:hypothetical protein CAOG_07227 [Capsaspora owczarzaki ATCC 30864]KJE97351.1 hypothetical protein CAOG_007227 [Capsaspora owczarzaki ATCC 30864]|eukprot:XP_004343086.1 hypothetical protein CAOG_07227 [Capsaspora owczarzaki ATCC 30864]
MSQLHSVVTQTTKLTLPARVSLARRLLEQSTAIYLPRLCLEFLWSVLVDIEVPARKRQTAASIMQPSESTESSDSLGSLTNKLKLFVDNTVAMDAIRDALLALKTPSSPSSPKRPQRNILVLALSTWEKWHEDVVSTVAASSARDLVIEQMTSLNDPIDEDARPTDAAFKNAYTLLQKLDDRHFPHMPMIESNGQRGVMLVWETISATITFVDQGEVVVSMLRKPKPWLAAMNSTPEVFGKLVRELFEQTTCD